MRRRSRPSNRYELFTCAWKGHALVGVGAATVVADDAVVVRELGGLRWHRCIRCDDWVPIELSVPPVLDAVPPRDQIEVPLRGPALRDRYVLRLIAIDRTIHVIVLTALALVIFLFLGHRHALQDDYDRIMSALTGGPGNPNGLHGFLGHFRHWFFADPAHLYEIGFAAIAYAALEATEAVGLWYAKRWAEYLTFLATIVFIPLEIDELTRSITTLKVLTLVINVAIALYLLVAKRLFGLRGGHRAVIAQRAELGGWAAVERNTVAPPRSSPPSSPAAWARRPAGRQGFDRLGG
ncbi:MAG: DUF2127 domain-containing protein [Acidimicrobiales bacterium]